MPEKMPVMGGRGGIHEVSVREVKLFFPPLGECYVRTKCLSAPLHGRVGGGGLLSLHANVHCIVSRLITGISSLAIDVIMHAIARAHTH